MTAVAPTDPTASGLATDPTAPPAVVPLRVPAALAVPAASQVADPDAGAAPATPAWPTDRRPALRRDRDTLFIDGAWVAPVDPAGPPFVVDDAATGQPVGRVPQAGVGDADRAVRAARAAAAGWAATPAGERAAVLRRAGALLAERQSELAAVISTEVGTPLPLAHVIQLGLPLVTLTATASLTESFAWSGELAGSTVVREPVGVVAAITPWNYPLHQVVAKVAPALGAGCTVVLKPSEVAPLSAFALAEVFADAGLPAGVFNLVTGAGPVVGEALAAHPDVDMVSFTGSTAAGSRVMAVAAATVKKVALELGGKSPLVALPDADVGAVVARAMAAAWVNNGQTCSALTRLVVPASQQRAYEEMLVALAPFAVLGPPADPATQVGPLISAAQQQRVRGYIELGVAEGARLLLGGPEQPAGLPVGYYVQPTVLTDVTPDMRVAQEEIFGPVLVLQTYADDGADHEVDDAAMAVANSTRYGLAGGVFGGADTARAARWARRIRAGQVEVNGAPFNPLAPFGGYGASGVGRELGPLGFEEFLETKAISG